MEDAPVYLQKDGKLSFTKPTAANSFSEYVSDPAKPVPYTEDVHFGRTINYMTDDQRFAARRPDVAVFESEVLDKDITLAGPVVADLTASTNTTDADFIVKVIDVFPDDFSQSLPGNYAVPLCAILPFAAFIFIAFVGGQAELRHRGSTGRVFDFRVFTQIANQDDFVNALRHGRVFLNRFFAL